MNCFLYKIFINFLSLNLKKLKTVLKYKEKVLYFSMNLNEKILNKCFI